MGCPSIVLSGQSPFISWGFSEVTHLTWGGLHVSPLVVMWETGAPDHHLDALLDGNKENEHGMRGTGIIPWKSPWESLVGIHKYLTAQSLQTLEKPQEDQELMDCYLLIDSLHLSLPSTSLPDMEMNL